MEVFHFCKISDTLFRDIQPRYVHYMCPTPSRTQLPSAETESLCRRIYELEEEVSHLKRELVRGREGELFETRGRCEQLTKTVEALEEQLGQQVSFTCTWLYECHKEF